MKSIAKFFIIFICLIFTSIPSFAQEEVNLEFDENYRMHSINITTVEELADVDDEEIKEEQTPIDVSGIESIPTPLPEIVITEETQPMTLYASIQHSISQTLKNIKELEIDDLENVTPLFEDNLTKHFERGPFSSLHTRFVVQNNFDNMFPEHGDSYSKYNVNLINILFDAKSKSGKDLFRVMLDVSHQHEHSFMQNLFYDLFYETKRIPHHSILIGNSRVGTGMEGLQSPYTLPFLNRSQISRNFSNVRKVGLRIRGDYKYVDYDFGGYSSDTFFTDFMPGAEFNSWVNLKPLSKNKEKFGTLKTGAGISVGSRHSTDYFVSGFGVQYSYKRLWTRAEYSVANGSNGRTGLTSKHRQGWYVTLGYKITKKLELMARYDEFDPDKSISGNNRREYSTGLNYYIKGQALKLVLNYIFCQNDNAYDSHRFMLGAQLAI